MKKLLTGVAFATLLASPAMADDQTNLKLGITGEIKTYMAFTNQNGPGGDDVRNSDILRDTEVHFVGETTLNNGLTVGADIGGDGDQGAGFDVTDSIIYFAGSFGKLNIGSTDSASYLLQVQPPAADTNYDGQEQYFTPFNYSATGLSELEDTRFDYVQDISEGGDKLTYITPIFDGFQAAVSWTPEARTASRSLNGVDDGTGLGDIIDLTARYNNKTSWGDYSVSGALVTAESRQLWNMATDFNIGAFGIGALYSHDNQDEGAAAAGATGQRQWILGVDYTMGNTTLGASYLNQNNEFGADEINTDRYSAGAAYRVGPGIKLHGVVTRIDHSVDTAIGNDVSGTAAMLGTTIAF